MAQKNATIGAAIGKLPKVSKETKIIATLIGLTVWVSYRVSRGLKIDPTGITGGLFDLGGNILGQSAAGYEEVAQDLGARTSTQTPHPLEKVGALVSRAAGYDVEPSIAVQRDTPADPQAGPFLGTPRNALLVAGKIRSPQSGQSVVVRLLDSTYPVDAAIENQSKVEVRGQVQARVISQGFLQGEPQITVVDGPTITLPPGGFYEVSMRLPRFRDANGTAELALLFSRYKLDGVTFKRELALF